MLFFLLETNCFFLDCCDGRLWNNDIFAEWDRRSNLSGQPVLMSVMCQVQTQKRKITQAYLVKAACSWCDQLVSWQELQFCARIDLTCQQCWVQQTLLLFSVDLQWKFVVTFFKKKQQKDLGAFLCCNIKTELAIQRKFLGDFDSPMLCFYACY